MPAILYVPPSSTAGRLSQETRERNISESSADSEFNEYVAQPLRELELILLKLKAQLKYCFAGILLTILGYLVIWSRSRCCAHPFQESSCAVKRIIPPMTTNHSTLAGEVDGFLASAQAKISNLENVIEMPSQADRQKTLDFTKDELWELIQEHSANLAAFGAIKREDERMEELKQAVSDGYTLLIPIAFFGGIYLWRICGVLDKTKISKRTYLAKLKELFEEDGENLQNARLKRIKRRIPIFILATLLCILFELGLHVAFLAGQYYAQSCPMYYRIEILRESYMKKGKSYLPKSFSDYSIFADELQTALDAHLIKLNKSMQSPILEVRQLGWDYEQEAIDRIFIHHTGLKHYHVDRNEMPRQLIHSPPANQDIFLYFLVMCLYLIISIFPLVGWVLDDGSVWRPWKFVKYYF